MKKNLLAVLALGLTSITWAQTPIETYSFDAGNLDGENGSTTLASTNATGTQIADADGNVNSAISLNGNEKILYNGLAINPYSGFSVSFWVKPSTSMTSNAGHAILSQRNACTGINSIESFANPVSQIISFSLRRSSGSVGVSVNYTPDVWQHLTFTFNQTDGKMRAYKDGVYQGISTTSVGAGSIPTSLAGEFRIADHICIGVDGTQRYAGGLDEVKVYNERLSELDVLLTWDENTDAEAYQEDVVTNSLVEEYDFTGFVTEYAEGLGFVEDKDQNERKAQYFDGTSGTSATAPTSTTSGYTMSFWLKPEPFSGSRSQIVISQRSACNAANSFEVYRDGTDVTFIVRTSAGGKGVKIPYTAGQWTKFTFVADQSTDSLYAYKNGNLITKEKSGSLIASNLSTTTLRFGNSVCVAVDETPRFVGTLDNVNIYQNNLTAQEILDAFTQDDDAQFNPVFTESFDFPEQNISEELRNDPATLMDDTSIVLTGNSGFNLDAKTIATNGDGYTFSFWVKPDGNETATNQVLFAKRDQCTWRDLFAMNVNGTTQKISIELRTQDQMVTGLALDYTPDVWQHVAYVVDLNELYLYGYLDGEKIDSVTITGHEVPGSYSSAVTLKLSSSPCTYSNYAGGIDELKIYTAPLLANNISTLHDGNPSVTGLWKETENVEEVIFYPNPAISVINLEKGNVTIYNAQGMLVLSSMSNGQVDVSSLSAGIYTLAVNGKKTKLVIK